MTTDLQGRALALLNRIAQADWPDRLRLRKSLEVLLLRGSRTGFRLATRRLAGRASRPLLTGPAELFDLSLSDEQQMLTDMLRQFALDELRPAALEADAALAVPAALEAQAAALGLAHYGVPEDKGGLAGGPTALTTALMGEALAYGDLSLAAGLLQPLAAAHCLRRWSGPDQQERWLPALLEEHAPRHALAVNEPQVLADPAAPATRARKRGKHYRLDGEKCLVLQGGRAEQLIVSAQCGDGPALFRVPADAPGVERRPEPAMGLRACATTRIRLRDVKVERDARLSGEGFDYRAFLDLSALGWCALAVGTAQAALDYVIPYCNERQAFGEPISHRQAVAFSIADMAIELEGMRLLLWRACARADQGADFHEHAWRARVFCAQHAPRIGSAAVQLLGGHGFTQEHPVERWYRDLRAMGVLHGGMQL